MPMMSMPPGAIVSATLPNYYPIDDTSVTVAGDLAINAPLLLEQYGLLTVGSLSGHGSIAVDSQSTLCIQSGVAPTSETITLQSGHLCIGEGGAVANPALQFLPPVTMDSASSIELNDTSATAEVYWKNTGQLDLFNGRFGLVAALNVHSSSGTPIWAQQVDYGGVPSMLLTASPSPLGWHVPVYTLG